MDPSKNEKEQALSLYFQEDVDPESYEQSFKLRQQLSSSLEGVSWFLQNSPFELPTTYLSAFECFKFRLSRFQDEFNPDILAELKDFLFDKSIEIVPNLPPNAVFELCNAQTYLSILIFPEYVPDLFDLIFQYPDHIKFRFLAAFCEYIILPTPKNVDKINTIKSFLAENNFYEAILTQIQGGIQQKIPDSINALASFIRWSVDLSYLNEDLISDIFTDTSDVIAMSVLKMITSIAQRGMPEEQKDAFIEAMQIYSHIEYYCQNYSENFDIISACAEATSILGYSMSKPLPELYNLLCIFFDQTEEISGKVIGCFRTFVRNNPESSDEVSVKVVERMVAYITNNPLTAFNRYLNLLFLLLKECHDQKQESFYNAYVMLLNNIKESDVSPDLSQLSAFLAITNYMFMYGIEFKENLLDEYFAATRSLFNIVPPINEQLFFPIFSFLRIFIFRPEDTITSQYNEDVLKQLILFSFDENLPEEIRKSFESLFFLYVKRKFKYCTKISDEIEKFVSAKTNEFMSISALILGGLRGNPKVDLTSKCFQYIEELLSQEMSFENLSLSLSFFSHFMAMSDDEKQLLYNDLSNILESCSENDDLMGSFILSIKGLGEQGFEYFGAVLPHVHGVRTITAAADVNLYFARSFKKNNNEEGYQNVCGISNNLVNIFVDFEHEALSMPLKSNEAHQLLAMTNSCYNLFIMCIDSICEDQELLNKLFDFTKELIITKYDIPQIMTIVLKFLYYASNKNPQYIATEFTGLSMYFILGVTFDPDKKEWDDFFGVLIGLHSELLKNAHKQFSEALSKVLQSFGLQEILESDNTNLNYLIALERDQREKFICVKRVIIHMLVIRNSLTW